MSEKDCLKRFLFEELPIRGEWVRLQDSWLQAKEFQSFANSAVENQLGQALTAAVLLSATIKFKGSMILQAQGSGALKALVAQSTHDRKIRGLVRSEDELETGTIKQMMGKGHLALTIEPEAGEPYQGIVALEQDHLAGMLETYFQQSEQLKTRLWLFADNHCAAGLLIQELPGQAENKEDWERIEMLADTVTEEELLNLDSDEMLYRLFNEEKVRVFDPESVNFSCSCSRHKISHTLTSLGREELEAILQERETIAADCQFCGRQFEFDRVDVENLLRNPPTGEKGTETQH